jgi:hypothetical protein
MGGSRLCGATIEWEPKPAAKGIERIDVIFRAGGGLSLQK